MTTPRKVTATMAELLEKDRINLDAKKIDADMHRTNKLHETGIGLTILAGACFAMWMAARVLTSWADSDMTDALQECGRVYVDKVDFVGSEVVTPANALIESCRKQVFEHFQVMT